MKANTKVANTEIIRLAKITLDKIEKERQGDLLNAINSVMEEDQRSFFACLFNKPPVYLTREQAVEYLKQRNSDDVYYYSDSRYNRIMRYNSELEQFAKNLIKLAEFSITTSIRISAEDLEQLG